MKIGAKFFVLDEFGVFFVRVRVHVALLSVQLRSNTPRITVTLRSAVIKIDKEISGEKIRVDIKTNLFRPDSVPCHFLTKFNLIAIKVFEPEVGYPEIGYYLFNCYLLPCKCKWKTR